MQTQYESFSNEADASNSAGTLLIGKVLGFNERGNPLVAYDETTRKTPIEALTTISLNHDVIGKDVAISFARNNGVVAIVMGVIKRALDDVLDVDRMGKRDESNSNEANEKAAIVDGKKLELSATDEVTIRCGKASISLNKNGKILIKGEHMLNRTAGSYKIKSGSIQLN